MPLSTVAAGHRLGCVHIRNQSVCGCRRHMKRNEEDMEKACECYSERTTDSDCSDLNIGALGQSDHTEVPFKQGLNCGQTVKLFPCMDDYCQPQGAMCCSMKVLQYQSRLVGFYTHMVFPCGL